MSNLPEKFGGDEEALFLSLARELAMDLRPIETILKDHGITAKDLENYMKRPRFKALVTEAGNAWQAVTNTSERIRLKAQAIVEEGLPEMFKRLHDRGDPLSSKVELLKTLTKMAGVSGVEQEAQLGNKVSITINMGDALPVTAQAVLPTQVIDADVIDL